MKKNLFIAAAALVALVSCSDDVIVDTSPVNNTEQENPIVFSSLKKGMTRSDFIGADAAEKLGNKFVVSAKKGSTTTSTSSKVVFDNYLVEYTENTAHTTKSNVANWEYVGKGRIQHAIDHGITSQTIKYWDYSEDQYDFIAWSTGIKTAIYSGTPTSGQVLVSSVNPNATASSAYTFTGSAADLSECYIADLVTVKKTNYGDDPVTFKFRQLGTKVRIGIYETIPGYSVKDVKFYQTAGLLTNPATEITTTPALFTTTANKIFTSGTYKVTFPTVDSPTNEDNNQAHVTFTGDGTQSTVVEWGGLNYTIAEEGEKIGTKFLGRTSNTASFAGNADDNYYVIFLPNEEGTNLNLRVDFTLESIDGGGEEIHVKNAKAQVPSIYTTWKPGFAYTYLFKISDKTNGRTGVYDPTQADDATVNSDPAGLYPITFDAVVVNAEDNDQTQETITTVMTPSITTYQKKSTVVNADEYKANGNDIFVTVNEGDNIVTLKKRISTDPVSYKIDAALYTIPSGKTEADVIDALQIQDDDAVGTTIKGRSGLVLTPATHSFTNSVEFGADGNAITIEAGSGENKAIRFTPTSNTTYAFVYTKTKSTSTTDKFQPITKAAGASVSGLYRYKLVSAPSGDMKKGVKYFANSNASTGMITAFLGQTVNNLYLDAAGNTIAKGYAVTGTTYYYTTDHGMTYKTATNIPYASFASATNLYTFDGSTYTVKPTSVTSPADNTAYYKRTGEGTTTDPYVYTYCVILPQQAAGYYVIDDTAAKVACGSSDVAVNGMTYFDKYTQNNGVYYTKIIKVQ